MNTDFEEMKESKLKKFIQDMQEKIIEDNGNARSYSKFFTDCKKIIQYNRQTSK